MVLQSISTFGLMNKLVAPLSQSGEHKAYTRYFHTTKTLINTKFLENSTFFIGTILKLVGLNEGYSYCQSHLLHWSQITSLVLYEDQKDQSQLFPKYSKFIAMAKDESFFIMQKNDKISIHSIDEKSPTFEIKLIKQVIFYHKKLNILDGGILYPKLSSDDNIFIINFLSTVGIYDIVQDKSYIIQYKKYFDFVIFDTKFDRFVLLRNDTVLQIRKLSDPLKILKSFQLELPAQIQIYNIRLFTSPNDNLQFIIMYQTDSYAGSNRQQVCTIDGDVLVYKDLKTNIMSFRNTFLSSRWLVSVVPESDESNYYTINVYNWPDFQIVNSQQLGYRRYFRTDSFTLYKDVLLIQGDPFFGQLISFNVGFSNPSDFKIRTVFSEYIYMHTGISDQHILFSQKGILLTFTQGAYYPIKVIMNATFPVDKKIQHDPFQIYIPRRKNETCDWILNANDYGQMTVEKNCQPFSPRQKYHLDTQYSISPNIYPCSDKNHIVVQYTSEGTWSVSKKQKIEIREIGNWSNILWETVYVPEKESIANIDLSDDNKLVINHYSWIEVIDLVPSIVGLNFNLNSINDFSPGKDGVLGIFGQHINSTQLNPVGTVIVIDKNKKILYLKNVTNISNPNINNRRIILNQDNSKLTICYRDMNGTVKIEVWLIDSYQRIFKTEFAGNQNLNDARYLNETHVFLRINLKNVILSITNNTQKDSLQHYVSTLSNSSKYAFSNDGIMMAFITSPTTVDIYDSNIKILSHIEIPSLSTKEIQYLYFSDNGTLFISDNQSHLFAFNQEPCSDVFVVNQSSYCACRKNQTQVGQGCQCLQNFVKKNLECLCELPFVLIGDACKCPANSVQKFNQCICNQNFINFNGTCICPQRFTYTEGQCFCGEGKYMTGQQCFECSFWCSKCYGNGFSCDKFSIGFYLIVVVVPLLIAVMIIAIVIQFKKIKDKKEKTLLEEESDQGKVKTQKSIEQGLLDQ